MGGPTNIWSSRNLLAFSRTRGPTSALRHAHTGLLFWRSCAHISSSALCVWSSPFPFALVWKKALHARSRACSLQHPTLDAGQHHRPRPRAVNSPFSQVWDSCSCAPEGHELACPVP